MLAVIILKIISNFVLPERKLLLEPTTAGSSALGSESVGRTKTNRVQFARYYLGGFSGVQTALMCRRYEHRQNGTSACP